MNPSIQILLELQVIDQRRQVLKRKREGLRTRVADAEKAEATARATAEAATAEVGKHDALVRQYTADAARCDATIAELRAKQMSSKTNKEYMAIINGIEQAKVEKAMREGSIKELTAKIEALKERADKAQAAAETATKALASAKAQSSGSDQPSAEEQEVQAKYDAIKVNADPAFLEAYERLVKANHKMPLCRVDGASRTTPFGAVLSHNQVEQIRMGKLLIDRTSNSIFYLAETKKAE